MSRYLRYLRIAFSAFSGIACVLLVVLWVRSYTWVEAIRPATVPSGGIFQIVSVPGALGMGVINFGKPWSFFRMTSDEFNKVTQQGGKPSLIWFRWIRNVQVSQIFVPYWMLLVATSVAGCLPWLRFSLRTLLIGTTAVAVVLGLTAYATRG